MDEGYVVVEVAAVRDLCEFVDAGQSGPFEDDAHRLVEYSFPEVWASLAEDRMDLALLQLVPKPVSGQKQRFVCRSQREVSDQRRSIDVWPGKDRNPREVVLLILEIKVPKGTGRLQSSLDITRGFTAHDILLIREGFE